MKGTLGSSLVTLVNLYLPNTGQIGFFESTVTELQDFAEGAVILGDDLNITMDPSIDT